MNSYTCWKNSLSIYADGTCHRSPTEQHRTREHLLSVGDNRIVHPGGVEMSDTGGNVQTHTVRLELVDEPGELLRALQPISEAGGNLLSIYHERGNLTPRGHIPVEVDISCAPSRFDTIVESLREAGVNVIQAGSERYDEELVVILVGHLVDTDLSDTLRQIESCADASLTDLSLSAPRGRDETSSARLRLKTRSGTNGNALSKLETIAEDKELQVIQPLTEASQ